MRRIPVFSFSMTPANAGAATTSLPRSQMSKIGCRRRPHRIFSAAAAAALLHACLLTSKMLSTRECLKRHHTILLLPASWLPPLRLTTRDIFVISFSRLGYDGFGIARRRRQHDAAPSRRARRHEADSLIQGAALETTRQATLGFHYHAISFAATSRCHDDDMMMMSH